MGGGLTCRAETGRPVGVVRVRGVYSDVTSPGLRAAVHECLADRPDTVMVDLSEMTTAGDGGHDSLATLTRVAQAAMAYAGVNIVVSAPSGQLHETLNGRLPVFASPAACLAYARQAGPPRRLRRRLPATPAAGQVARATVDRACRAWAVEQVADRAATVATELVANAVLHAVSGGEVALRLALLDHRLYVAVQDGDTRPPRLGGPDEPDAEGGSGLLVVDALASAWGFAPIADGKVVWASLLV